MDFLVPTLHVAKELEWNGNHDLDQLYPLEKLEEDRLKEALVGVYATKRRQKQWYDTEARSRHFQLGDHVLLYTPKRNKRKI